MYDTLIQLFSTPSDPSMLTYGQYDPALVALSVLVAIFSSWMGLQIAGQASANRTQRSIVLLTGSLALGSGVWAMHFIGMLAFDLCTHVDYDPATTIVSLIPSVGASFVALSLISRKRITPVALLVGGVLVGAGIGAMHYAGMAGMRMSLQLRYDPFMFGLSIVVAVVLATLALWVRFGLRSFRSSLTEPRLLLISAVVMGCAIAGMHYTGMAAARFIGQLPPGATGSSNSTFVALAVSLITVAFTIFVLSANGLLRYRHMFKELTESEAWMRSLIANIPGISYRSLLSSGYPMVFVSDAVEQVTGYPAADFYGQPPRRTFGSLIHPADVERVNAEVELATSENRPYLLEYRLLHADGSTRWLWGRGIGVRNEAGELAWLDGVILDISERHAMEQALRQAKEKAEHAAASRATFVANMSHEIRTPMNAILGFTDVVLDGELVPEQRRHLDTVRSAGRSLLRLLNEILDTAKLDKGAMELDVADFNLLGMIDELSSTLGGNARAKGLHIDINYDPSLPACLRGDEMRIRQVLTNLLDNAIKFTAAGSVTLVAEGREEQLHFLVQDTGIGIAPDRLAAIFEPFTQADASMTRRYGGTGLGTTISKQLVDLMGGRIWADSEPGQGTSFHVLLPLTPAKVAQTTARVRTAAVLPPLRILAADDVPQNLELLDLLLQRRGHHMTGVADGAEAVRLAAERDFDLILMDLQMPKVDGLDATRAIRAAAVRNGQPRVPVVAMTASVLEAHRRASSDADMDGFASKPVEWITLSHEIARVLGLESSALAAELPSGAREVFNQGAGLRRWSGHEDAFHHALAQFRQDYATLADRLAGQVAANDLPGMGALAHKARGVAANLGLELLADALAQLERDLALALSGADHAALAAQLKHVRRAAGAALGAIEALVLAAAGSAPAAREEAPDATVDLARARNAGAALAQSFARGAIDDDALAELAQTLGAHAAAASLLPIHAAVADFDFTLAQSRLATLLAAISDNPVPEPSA